MDQHELSDSTELPFSVSGAFPEASLDSLHLESMPKCAGLAIHLFLSLAGVYALANVVYLDAIGGQRPSRNTP